MPTNFVLLTKDSKPTDLLDLPKGRLAVEIFEASFSPENVMEAAKLVIANGGREDPFVSQAGVIEYAGNNLGWGLGGGYKTI